MPSIVAVSCVLAMSIWFGASSAYAQSKSGRDLQLEVRSDDQPAQTCLTAEQLRARVAYYSSRRPALPGMRLVLYVQSSSAELQIVRNGAVVSRRLFQQLPAACADRRDAVALSIALALERAVEAETAAAKSSSSGGATPAAGEASSAVSGAASETAAEHESQNQGEPLPPLAAVTPPAADETQAAQAPPPAAAPQPPPEPEPEPEPEPGITTNLPNSISHVSARDRASPVQFHLGARLTLEAVPMPVWVGALGLELPLSSHVTLDITGLVSSTGESSLAGAQAKAGFVGLEALGCAALPLSVFMLQICGGASVGLCTVSGSGYFRERPEATLLWAAGLARVMLRWPRSELFAVRLLLQPHLSFSRPELQVERSSAQLRTHWIGGSAGLELWLALP